MKNLEKVQNRRKAVLWISSGYDFNPFQQSRLEEDAQRFQTNADDLANDPFYKQQTDQQNLAEADLIHELAELTRAANRANATIYTMDPRGLIAGAWSRGAPTTLVFDGKHRLVERIEGSATLARLNAAFRRVT